MKCLVCEKELKEKKGRGRPSEYCCTKCSNFMKFFNAMEKNLNLLDLSDEAKRHIKGDLFRVGNLLKIENKGIKSTKIKKDMKLVS